MAILGSIVKSAIGIKHSLGKKDGNPEEQQRAQLDHLLQKASSTAFGIYYQFDAIGKAADPIKAFQQNLPIFEYETMNARWWQQQQIAPDITWPGKPDFFALSAGTTGDASKRVPVTEDMLESIRAVGLSQAESLARFDLPPELFEKEILMLSSSAQLKRHRNGHLEGEISGISTNNIPTWFSGFYRPGLDIASIDNWDDRVDAIAKAAPDWDIGALAGIPSWVQMMLRRIMDYHQLDTIHDIWPSLQLYATGGVAFGPYRESFEQLTAKPLIYLDTYLASEGFFAYNGRPDTMNMRLATHHGIFYEFIPFDERGFDEMGNMLDDPEVLHIGQVEEGTDYALLVSTPAGTWRYMIGDTVRFTDLERMELRISGRTKYFLNVVGSQLSEDKMNDAIEELSQRIGQPINEYAVSALKDDDGDFYHQWVLALESASNETDLAAQLDEILNAHNKNYAVARQKALKDVRVMALPKDEVYEWLERRKKKGGQVKMPRVMKTEDMEDLLRLQQVA
ncbi:MAG: GH3 auxin-responsive promoter [Bacteroidetes bacterium]|jgi:hypothetical protein|nr:GH3 auxin-responsive promoter [Bacteroidota bacterium]